ncbi:sodium export permease protein [Geomicrobium sp. JCM 19037]|uniref:ABC transporter permease n=1 Tax=Geomicrobium sp. JCM 19037 TaxID=1460634 RepID=UPI00045F3931|nr:ABC transporter permease [Geomicrobium sp. JCM 19037]GAK06133.1 sodium export permease protein [Geomicrobium sp. JCM 19037]
MIAIIKKEMKDALRDQRTLLLSVFAPVLLVFVMIFFLGGAGTDDVIVGLDPDLDDELSEALQQSHEDWHFLQTDRGEALLEDGDIDLWVEADEEQLTAKGDYASPVVSHVERELMNVWEQYEATHRSDVLQSAGLSEEQLTVYNWDSEPIGVDERSVPSVAYFFTFILLITVLMAGFPAAVDLFAGEKEKQTMESLLMAPLRRSQIVISKWVVITVINFISGVIVFAGSVLFANAFHQSGVIIAGDQLLSIALFLTLSLLAFAALNAALLVVISVSTASYKDAQNMSTPVMFAWLAAPIYLLTAPLSSWSIWMFFVPALNVSALIYGITAAHLSLVCQSTLPRLAQTWWQP